MFTKITTSKRKGFLGYHVIKSIFSLSDTEQFSSNITVIKFPIHFSLHTRIDGHMVAIDIFIQDNTHGKSIH